MVEASDVVCLIEVGPGARRGLHREYARRARDLELPLVAVYDPRVDADLIRYMEQLGVHAHKQDGSTFGSATREALRHGMEDFSDAKSWNRAEPEKVGYVEHITKVARPIVEWRADMVVPKRMSMNTYPSYQQNSEPFINNVFEVLTGVSLDITFGPKSWNRKAARYIFDYENWKHKLDLWDSQILPCLWMINDGLRVESIEVDYQHPSEQTAQEQFDSAMIEKRVAQLEKLTRLMLKAKDELPNLRIHKVAPYAGPPKPV